MRATNKDTDFEFLLGMIAGEGSFMLTFSEDERRRFGVCYGVRFTISMGQFSQELLETLRDIVDLGRVQKAPKGHVWRVSSRQECHTLRNRIDSHLECHDSVFPRSQKFESYEKWRQALELLQPGRRLTKAEIIKLAYLKDEINPIPDTGRSAEELIAIIEESE